MSPRGRSRVFGAWRAIFAPKGISPEQAAYWAGVLRKATEAPEWKQDLERNYWVNVFTAGDAFAKELERDYAAMKAVLSDIGLAK